MFTGIIEEVGSIAQIKKQGEFAVVTIKAKKILKDVHLGDSIAVNGVCLTVTSFTTEQFTADVMSETLKRTSLGELGMNSPVNLERAMAANGRFGGHIVSGHIDGTGTIAEITPADNATWYRIQTSPKLMRYIIEKGSITIDGISLTVVDTDENSFRVSIIPHTIKETNLGTKKVGSLVNLENDIVGKYIEQFLLKKEVENPASKLTVDFLKNAGF
ncbi:riboflavin synthase subunit alpha [Mannheimia granulomatis]|uniref:Riboflavin synthase n=1 Tax=Mannheimia granulomatis TaxID=85402 RepID=A0A011NEX6_9PAST|nr:riboflavin synthase [Mannheimia granulomatis]EXI62940.1 riboflavin synthase subunit alpha [Mannheimia granulomatis]QLB19222.1 riboflavin synthase subunit alpha [Mannheimia granulomatis]RGE48743.1 riboflavin synthase subunit alpha [Mannheimia granulomatis]